MKKCPYCAEEIQEEAIKCRFCDSWLNKDADAAEPAIPIKAHVSAAASSQERKVLYSGSPSWKAYFREYALLGLAVVALPLAGHWIAGAAGVGTGAHASFIAVPILLAMIGFAILHFYRRSRIFRISTTNIESEFGILSKKIDVLELWRCRDIRYQQSLVDRILGVAHIEIFTADVTSPSLKLDGLPASRQLFEKIRDSIEIQRQARNVVGFVQ